tara:strand:- start:373 stop:909 length:537 start_codon:yes stop_codon:yes gene_type:complete
MNGKKERTMKKLLTLIITATIVVAISGCDFRTHTTVYPKHGPTVVYKSSPSPTVIVQEPSPYPSSTTVIYENPAQFYCDDGVSIPYEWECDGVDDCWGGEDEYYCGGSVVIVEEYYTPEPYYTDYCEASGSEECCYDYDWNIVWLNSHEYVYEVCEYTSCVDYYWNDAWDAGTNCWYE